MPTTFSFTDDGKLVNHGTGEVLTAASRATDAGQGRAGYYVVLVGARPDADADAERLRNRFGWDVTVEPEHRLVPEIEIPAVGETVFCPVCEQEVTEIDERNHLVPVPELVPLWDGGPLVESGSLPSRHRAVGSTFTFEPCGDSVTTDPSPRQEP